ncbi:TetR family transcriptional regulator [Actinomadura harenae]|uniref:TetR family transcriptional regulator n=1 Tax=Actinomadura harenae TaxID=2483351 RepID=A0A3M2M023_9ACTN|nr:TetR family transcriptional regulator [Actinomadura harenae]RMI42203.1 TetR family transcriptional regulator [Actinomadura harenae]
MSSSAPEAPNAPNVPDRPDDVPAGAAVSPDGASAAEAPSGGGGLRERKKRRTRTSLIDAALVLFLAQGYDTTTVDEIVAAVHVSQRTFFRYFATKEDVVTGFFDEHDQWFADRLRERPAGERPFTALFETLRMVLKEIADSGPEDAERFRRIRRVLEAEPALKAAQMARYERTEGLLARIIAEREGVDPVTDPRPEMVVAFYSGATRVAFEHCAHADVWDPKDIAARVEAMVDVASAILRDWI